MKRTLALILCLMLMTGSALAGGMVDFAGVGAVLFTDGALEQEEGSIRELIGQEDTEAGSGIYEAFCGYVPYDRQKEEAFEEAAKDLAAESEEYKALQMERDSSALLLFAIQAVRDGVSPEAAREAMKTDPAAGMLSEGIEIGQYGELTYYLYPALPTAQEYLSRSTTDIEKASAMIAEITAHPEHFVFKNPGEKTCGVRILDPEGNPVARVLLTFCTDEMCMPVPTGADGRALLHGAQVPYHVQVVKVPEGLKYDGGEMDLGPNSGIREITLLRSE